MRSSGAPNWRCTELQATLGPAPDLTCNRLGCPRDGRVPILLRTCCLSDSKKSIMPWCSSTFTMHFSRPRDRKVHVLKGRETFSPQVAGPTSQGEALWRLSGFAIFVRPCFFNACGSTGTCSFVALLVNCPFNRPGGMFSERAGPAPDGRFESQPPRGLRGLPRLPKARGRTHNRTFCLWRQSGSALFQ